MRSLSSNVLSTSTRKTIGLGVMTRPPPFHSDYEAPYGLSFLSALVANESLQPTTTLRYSASSSCLPHDRVRSFEPLDRDCVSLAVARGRAQPTTTTRGVSNPARPGRFHLPATSDIATSFAAGTAAALHTIRGSWDYHACRYIRLC